MDALTPQQIGHLWETANILLMTKALDNGTDIAIKEVYRRLHSATVSIKNFATQVLCHTKVPMLLDQISNNPNEPILRSQLETELLDNLTRSQLQQLSNELVQLKEIVDKSETGMSVSFNNSQSNNGVQAGVIEGNLVTGGNHYYGTKPDF